VLKRSTRTATGAPLAFAQAEAIERLSAKAVTLEAEIARPWNADLATSLEKTQTPHSALPAAYNVQRLR